MRETCADWLPLMITEERPDVERNGQPANEFVCKKYGSINGVLNPLTRLLLLIAIIAVIFSVFPPLR